MTGTGADFVAPTILAVEVVNSPSGDVSSSGDKSSSQKDGDGNEESKVGEAGWRGIAAWIAGAFGLLAGVLAYLGVKDLTLYRLVGSYPYPTMLVFILVGIAVVTAILVPGLADPAETGKSGSVLLRRYLELLLIVGTALSLVVSWAVPNIGGVPNSGGVGLALVMLLIAAVVALVFDLLTPGRARTSSDGTDTSPVDSVFSRRVSLPFAMLGLGAVCLSFGFYSAVKVAVLSKVPSIAPRVEASLEGTGVERVVSVTLSAAQNDPRGIVLVRLRDASIERDKAADLAAEQESGAALGVDSKLLGQRALYPDGTGLVEGTVKFRAPTGAPVVAIDVWSCSRDQVTNCGHSLANGTFAGSAATTSLFIPENQSGSLGVGVATTAEGVPTASVVGANLTAGDVVQLCVAYDGVPVMTASRPATEAGAFEWTEPMPAMKAGTTARLVVVNGSLPASSGGGCETGDGSVEATWVAGA